MSGRFTKIAEGVRVAWFRFAGVWFIVWSALAILFSLVMLFAAIIGPSNERSAGIVEALLVLVAAFVSMYLGMQFVSITAQDFREAPSRLAKLRDRFEAWVNRERKDV